MHARKENSAATSDRELLVTRVFDAPRHLVFRAWADGEQMRQWSAPHGFSITHCEGDAEPGARWRCCMRSPDGKEMWLGGVYREVVEDELLLFTHAWDDEDGKPGYETVVTVRFEDDEGGKTRMIFRQGLFDSVESRDGHRSGWSEGFERLDTLLARQS